MAKAPAKSKTESTALVNWEEEMAAQADVAAGAQRSGGGGGAFFSMKAGQLSFDGNAMPGNQMAVVILAAVMENSWYSEAYDPDTPASPKCFAFAQHEDALEPHSAVDNDEYFERQHDVCNGCPQNEWGSAPTGKGKACKNVMRLCMIPAGAYKSKGAGRNAGLELELFDDPDYFAKATEAYMKLPVMSVKNYAAFVKQLAADVRRPPHGVIVNVAIEPDAKSQFKVVFELLEVLDTDLLPVIMARHKAAQAAIDFPYTPPMKDEEAAPQKANSKLAKKPAAKKR